MPQTVSDSTTTILSSAPSPKALWSLHRALLRRAAEVRAAGNETLADHHVERAEKVARRLAEAPAGSLADVQAKVRFALTRLYPDHDPALARALATAADTLGSVSPPDDTRNGEAFGTLPR